MNIFVTNQCPETAARDLCDKHIVKMPVETAQMMASAVRRHGAVDEDMPTTKSKTPYKGGYPNHPCTRWAGDTRRNFAWLARHGLALCDEYEIRYGREHACRRPILWMSNMDSLITEGPLTPHPQAMPDGCKRDDPVDAYRTYYIRDKRDIAQWSRSRVPDWFKIPKSSCY